VIRVYLPPIAGRTLASSFDLLATLLAATDRFRAVALLHCPHQQPLAPGAALRQPRIDMCVTKTKSGRPRISDSGDELLSHRPSSFA